MSANASLAKQRRVALHTRLGELTAQAFVIVDCATAGCRGPRRFLVRELAGVYGRELMLAALKRMRCNTCGGLPLRASPVTVIGQRNPIEIRVQLAGLGTPM